jgi:hypothetical protein
MKQLLLKPSLLLFSSLVFLSAFMPKPAATDFSGKWKLNEAKSELGQFANFATRLIETVQNAESISISRTAPSFDGNDVTTKEQLTFDGKEAESPFIADSKKKSIAAWSPDAKMLKITYSFTLSFDGQSNEIKGTEAWTLSDDGKTLTVKGKSSSSFGDLETTSVYEKQ